MDQVLPGEEERGAWRQCVEPRGGTGALSAEHWVLAPEPAQLGVSGCASAGAAVAAGLLPALGTRTLSSGMCEVFSLEPLAPGCAAGEGAALRVTVAAGSPWVGKC